MQALLAGGLLLVLSLLPECPFEMLYELGTNSMISEVLGMVNWFIPIYSFVAILEGWLAAVAVYYVYQVVLRWLKAIE